MEDSVRQRARKGRCVKAGQTMLDFANIFKAFIGINYLSASFNFKQSGLLLGCISIILIASATVHCCHLIVKCKKLAVNKIMDFQKDSLCSNASMQESAPRLKLRNRMERRLTYGDIAWIAGGRWGLALVNCGLAITQFGFCVGYFIFLGNTLRKLFPLVRGIISFPATALLPSLPDTLTTEVPTLTHNDTTIPTTVNCTDFVTFSDADVTNSANITNMTNLDPSYHYTGPSSMYYIIVASLVPVFVAFAFLRNIRHMGPASLIANISMIIGYCAVMGYILSDFHVSDTVELVQWSTFPIFFGGVTAGYEGIGTIIPIESSMEGSRRLYPHLLYIAMILFTLILASMGIIGYLNYGEDIQQVIIWNLPANSVLPIMVNSVISLGIVFTFPLQNFPLIEICEELFFAQGKCCGPPEVAEVDLYSNERSPLLKEHEADDDMAEVLRKLPVATAISELVPTWKRNIVRTVIILIQAGVAVIFKDDFAYFSAFVGAIGSTTLAYIIPCVVHILLGGRRLGWPVIAKNVLLILFGITGGCSSIYATVAAML